MRNVCEREVVYPESDGKPIAETDWHINQLLHLVSALEIWFQHAPSVYVSGNNLLYYHQGDPRLRVSPDVYIVKGVENRSRRVYKLWEEKKAPCVVIEISSKGTRREAMARRRAEAERDALRAEVSRLRRR